MRDVRTSTAFRALIGRLELRGWNTQDGCGKVLLGQPGREELHPQGRSHGVRPKGLGRRQQFRRHLLDGGGIGRIQGLDVNSQPLDPRVDVRQRWTAPNRSAATATAASRASDASSAVRVRSAARNRSPKASDFLPSSMPWPA